ncbi:MAG: SMI1/KNR4 family protein [bacterium]|nr:SMI1/KNR4 family protein [bacterium]
MTLGPRLQRLLEIGSAPFGPPLTADDALAALDACGTPFAAGSALRHELAEMLAAKNGWLAFESALNVFGIGAANGDLRTRNAPDGWRAAYGASAEGMLFFAEDLFGAPFALGERGVIAFDPETGESEQRAPTLEMWAQRILGAYDELTGHTLAHEWQVRNGALPVGMRLVPEVPFVLGGAFEASNLRAREPAAYLRERARLAAHIAGLADGAQIVWPLAP